MKIPLIAGRFFTDADMPQNAEPVVVVDNKFAQRFWPKGDAVGKHVWFDPAKKLRIVGVVGTVKQYGLDVDGRIVVYTAITERRLSGGENDRRPHYGCASDDEKRCTRWNRRSPSSMFKRCRTA